jgi:hypothetical protein
MNNGYGGVLEKGLYWGRYLKISHLPTTEQGEWAKIYLIRQRAQFALLVVSWTSPRAHGHIVRPRMSLTILLQVK